MTMEPAHFAQLFQLIQEETTGLESMVQLLEEEQAVLVHARIDQLGALLDTKTKLIHDIEIISAQRRALLVRMDVPETPRLANQWFTQQAPELQEAWKKLTHLAKEALGLNTSNGKLIQTRDDANRRLISLLRPEHNESYTADGRLAATSATSRRPLDQA